MILFRPVGLKELELIAQLDFQTFPPRLEFQLLPCLDVKEKIEKLFL